MDESTEILMMVTQSI
jgi:AP-1 complex subunit gamma-1